MKTTSLGGAGLQVSPVGLGCMGMSQGYGQADDDESLTTLYRAVELGVTFWDTAQSYGAGQLEQAAAVHPLSAVQLLGQGDDVAVIPGTKHAARLAENAAAAGLRLSPSDAERLESIAPRSAWAGDRDAFAAHRTVRAGSR